MKEKQYPEYLIRIIMALLMVVTFAGIAWGYEGMATPKLHVEGRFLKDPSPARTFPPWIYAADRNLV